MSEKSQTPEHSTLRHFDDFDRFADAARGWDLDFRQLDRGPLSAEIFQVCSRESVLMRVRFSRALRSGSCETVADAANHCGFWHMGKFAADYRSQFAELPSDTLRQSTR